MHPRPAPSRRLAPVTLLSAACWLAIMPVSHAAPQTKPPAGVTVKPGALQKPGTAPAIPTTLPKPLPTAVHRARITTSPDGRPLARARVMLTRPDTPYAWVTITDDEGKYEITALEGFDDYMLSASKTGDHQGPLIYAATFYPGVASPEGATRDVGEGERKIEDLRVRRPRGSTGAAASVATAR